MRTKVFVFILVIAALALAACQPQAAAPTVASTAGAPAGPTALPPTPQAGDEVAATGQQWSQPPAMSIDPNKLYLARFKTEKGDIEVELLADKAPLTVNNFVFLAREGYYDNTTFHRVLADFMAQGGDPTGTGGGGPGYTFADEFHPDLRFDEPGLLAMANGGPGTNGSQFFITYVPTPHLTGRHTIFGKVVSGMDVALALRLRDPQTNPDFTGDKLLTVEIEELSESRLPPPTPTPEPVSPEPAEGRPLADVPPAERENLYNQPPAMVIDPAKTYIATIETSQGNVTVELHPEDAPESVNNFVVLANLGYWDNFPIVYVDSGLFLLTGSPAGHEQSDVGYVVPPEIKRTHVPGSIGYWYRPDRVGSSGSQFYILLAESPGLDEQFTTFGTVTEGLDVAGALTTEDVIEKITIEEQ